MWKEKMLERSRRYGGQEGDKQMGVVVPRNACNGRAKRPRLVPFVDLVKNIQRQHGRQRQESPVIANGRQVVPS